MDRGYKGKQFVGEVKINMPKPPLKRDIEYQKRKKRKHFRKRAAIEPIIGSLKQDHRAARNYLKRQVGDTINFMMTAAGFNFRKLMKKLKTAFVLIINSSKFIIIQLLKLFKIETKQLIYLNCSFSGGTNYLKEKYKNTSWGTNFKNYYTKL